MDYARYGIHGHKRLLVPGIQPAVRALLRRYGSYQTRDELRQVDSVRYSISVLLRVCRIAVHLPDRLSVHGRTERVRSDRLDPADRGHDVYALQALQRGLEADHPVRFSLYSHLRRGHISDSAGHAYLSKEVIPC